MYGLLLLSCVLALFILRSCFCFSEAPSSITQCFVVRNLAFSFSMAAPVPLHFIRALPKIPLSSSTEDPAFLSARKVRFLLLHGFLAHGGSLHSLVVNLRNRLDSYNRKLHSLATTSTPPSGPVIDYQIISLDARNHGLSPHTSVHVLPDLVADLGNFLATSGAKTPEAPVTTIGIGHSMGSGTLAYYLMKRQAAVRRGFFEGNDCDESSRSGNKKTFTNFGFGSVPLSPELFKESIDAFVSLDMPPITGSEMSDKLRDELVGMMVEMEKVNLANIVDMRSAHEEFLRCGMTDMRIRGLCSTNLLLRREQPQRQDIPKESQAPCTAHPHVIASWKCNLPVLKRSLAESALFFPAGFEAHTDDFSFPLEVPVLSILGGASPIGGKARFQEVWPRFAVNLEQHVVPDATHTVFFDKPEETVDLILQFLERIGVLQKA